MAKIKTSANGRRYVEIDGVIERRLEQIKNGKNGNGDRKPATRREDNAASRKTVEQSNPRGQSAPAA